MYSTVIERIRRIVAEIFSLPFEDVLPSSSPDTISAWDSLNHLNLVLALEQEFSVQFTPEEIEQLLSVELISALVEEKIPASEVEPCP